MYDIEFCYDNGNLERALIQAARFVETIGDGRVHTIIARQDDNIVGAWWVDVIYIKEQKR